MNNSTKPTKTILTIITITLLCTAYAIYAVTQDGQEGNPSVGRADIEFDIASVVQITGLLDVNFGSSLSQFDVTPIDIPNSDICLYSSTGKAQVTAMSNAGGNTGDDLKFNSPPNAPDAFFRLELDNQEMSEGTPRVFNNVTEAAPNCGDGSIRTMTATLNTIPDIAGTYMAVVTLTMIPIE